MTEGRGRGLQGRGGKRLEGGVGGKGKGSGRSGRKDRRETREEVRGRKG